MTRRFKISGKYVMWSWIVCVIAVSSIDLRAQEVRIGGGIGGILYWGDLTPKDPIEGLANLRFGGQVFLKTYLSDNFATRFNFMLGGLHGDDGLDSRPSRSQRNLDFHSVIAEFSFIGEYDFLRFDFNSQKGGWKFTIGTGISLLYFNPKTEYQGVTYALQPLGTEGQGMDGFNDPYSRVAFALPLIGAMKIKLSDNLTLIPEISVRISFSDYLDDVSSSYVNFFELRTGNGDIAAALADRVNEGLGINEPRDNPTGGQRGNPNVDDWYFTGMISLSYTIGEVNSIFSGRGGGKYSDCPTF